MITIFRFLVKINHNINKGGWNNSTSNNNNNNTNNRVRTQTGRETKTERVVQPILRDVEVV